MWHIFIDKSDNQYLILHFDADGVSDLLLRSELDCWAVNILDYTMKIIEEFPQHLDDFSELTIIHSFESDDPISYIQSLPQTHPELFI